MTGPHRVALFIFIAGSVFCPFDGRAEDSAGAASLTLHFDDIPRFIKEKNQNVTGAQKFSEAADERTGYLVRSYLPTLEAHGGGETFQLRPYGTHTQPFGGLEARMNLFRGGRDLLESRVRDSQKVIADANAKRTYFQKLTEARKTYWTLVSNREAVSILKRALAQNEENFAVAKRRIDRGLGTQTDRLEFEIYRSQLEEEVESLTHANLLIEIHLAALLGMARGTTIQTEETIQHEHDDTLMAMSFDSTNHPEVLASRASEEGAASQRTKNYLGWAPSVDLYGGYFLYTLRDREYLAMQYRSDAVVGLRLTLPLFDGLQSQSEGASHSRQALGYQEQSIQNERDLLARSEVGKEDLKHDHELIHRIEERIVQGKKYLSQTLDEYGRGVKNSIDVLAAAQKQLSFEKQYVERRRNYQITKADLLALFGR